MASEISLLHARPATPGMTRTLRSKTSAQIISVMPNTSAQATSANASSSLPYAASARSMLLREHLLEFGAVHRARLDGVRPADFLRLLDIGPGGRRVEADRLDARRGLALRLLLVVGLPEVVLLLVRERLAIEILALRARQSLVLVEVDDQRDLGVVEAGVDAVFGVLLPVEVEE